MSSTGIVTRMIGMAALLVALAACADLGPGSSGQSSGFPGEQPTAHQQFPRSNPHSGG